MLLALEAWSDLRGGAADFSAGDFFETGAFFTGATGAFFAAGARFAVSPGLTQPLCAAAASSGIPLLPGVSSAGDIMRGLSMGLDRFKFFPAVAAGGLPMLRALAAPFANVRFCPTGGVTRATASDWLKESSVLWVGGSWLVVDRRTDIEAVRAAAALRGSKDRVVG